MNGSSSYPITNGTLVAIFVTSYEHCYALVIELKEMGASEGYNAQWNTEGSRTRLACDEDKVTVAFRPMLGPLQVFGRFTTSGGKEEESGELLLGRPLESDREASDAETCSRRTK